MAQNTSNQQSTLNGLFKQVYAKSVKTAIPNFAILQARLPFSKAAILGDKYHLPVVLSDEHGFTYGGSSGANYTLNSAVSLQMQDAQVPGSELTLQSGMSYGAVSRAQSKGSTAVEGAVGILIERMKASTAKRVEIAMIYGGSGIGQIVSTSTTGSAGTRVYTISTSSFAAGIWAGLENANLDLYTTVGVKLNTNAGVVITAVSVGLKTVTISGNSADLTAIDAATNPKIYFMGTFGNEMTGLDQIMINTGVLFNIDASAYNLWAAQTYDCQGSALTMNKVLSAVNLAVGRGLMQDVQLLVAADSWANLNANLAGQRMFDGSYKSSKAENGVESIKYHSSNGMIEVICHPFVKSGEAFLLPLDNVQRVGSTDIDFRGDGPDGQQEYLVQNPTTNGWICRAYTDQAVLIETPAMTVKLINITATP